MKKTSLMLILFLVASLSVGCKPWTIVKNEKLNEDDSIKIYFASDSFDADAFAKDVWDNQLISYYSERKVDGNILVTALKEDTAKAQEEYGQGSDEIGSNWTFIVEGKGKVIDVDTSSRAGIMGVDFEPFDGQVDVKLQIGPVIKGSAIRDTLDYIKLDDFSNQVEFASISKAFNGLLVTNVLGDRDYAKDIGKTVTFLGCFTYDSVEEILIAPVQLEFEEGQ